MQAINIFGATPVGSTVYREIAIEICDGCILTTFMLVTLGMWMQAKEVEDDVRQLRQRAHLTLGLSALIVGNVALAVIFMLSSLKWTTA